MIAHIVLPIPVQKWFDYEVPEDLQTELRPGCRVIVPFGRRVQTGLVVGIDHSPGENHEVQLKTIQDVIDEEPALTGELLDLTRWISTYYMCGWGEVIRAALPSGTDYLQQYLIRYAGPERLPDDLSASQAALIELIRMQDAPTLEELQKKDRSITLAALRRLEKSELVTIEPALKKPRVRIKKEKHLRLADPIGDESTLQHLKSTLPGTKQRALVDALYHMHREGEDEPSQAAVLTRSGAGSSTARSLVDRGILRLVDKEVMRTPLGDLPLDARPPPNHALHAAQEKALQAIEGAIEAGRFETFLLHGITGSGKTEVYIHALKRVTDGGKTGIILVPEIALTPQTVSRFQAHFGDRIAVLHSRMSLGERFDAWRHLRKGRYPIVIGPRSAILAPLSDIGLIIVDEEHEGSYKQFDPAPRYHARDVAVMRASMNQAVCILGSATPSLESYYNATQASKYTYLSMPDRVPVPGTAPGKKEMAQLPVVKTIDLSLEKKKHRLPGILSAPLRQALSDRLQREEQVILLQNRRGYSSILLCQSCGWTPMCSDCAVTLTYHKVQQQLRCHYCGKTEQITRRCPQCGGADLARIGAGTQRVEEELDAYFPEARVLRMDLDTTSGKNAHHKILDQFGRGAADVLLGTQMVAKGLDFARVTLVGVINADVGMLLPDFRAEERTFQLLTQVAGRAGRAGSPGEVLLQTRNPKHAVLQFALRHDYIQFARSALRDREALMYPPYGRIARIEFKGPEDRVVERLSKTWARVLKPLPGVQVLGPQPALISRIQKQYRHHVILKAHRSVSYQALRAMISEATNRSQGFPRHYRMVIDIDAMSLL